MNTWASYTAGSLSGIVLHSVPPLVVFVAAEAVTDLRDKLTETATVAFTTTAHRLHDHATEHGAGRVRPKRSAATSTRRRKYFDDYLAEARQAWTPEVVVTPAWVRETTGCSRGLSSRLASTLAAELDASHEDGEPGRAEGGGSS